MAPGGSGPRPPGTMTWLRGACCTDPEEMPEKEARPLAQNRHGGAPRGERVPLDARRASPGTARRAPKRATTGIPRLSALRSPLMGWMEQRKSKTRAQQRAAGTKKTALFDIVNRNIAATRLGPRRARASVRHPDNALVSRPSARPGADLAHGIDTRARAGTQGPRDVPRQPDIALRTFLAGSRVSFRFAPLARDTRAGRTRGNAPSNPSAGRGRWARSSRPGFLSE